MSGKKISKQEIINNIKREQLAQKAMRLATETANIHSLNNVIICYQNSLRSYLSDLNEMKQAMMGIAMDDDRTHKLKKDIEDIIDQIEIKLSVTMMGDICSEYEDFVDSLSGFLKIIPSRIRVIAKEYDKVIKRQNKMKGYGEIVDRKIACIIEKQDEALQEVKNREEIEITKEYSDNCEKMEREYVREAIVESMKELGCEVIATKRDEETNERSEHLFSYDNGTAIHMIECDDQITMEVVGIGESDAYATDEEENVIRDAMLTFESTYDEMSRRLALKGIAPKDGSEVRIAPEKIFVRIQSLEDMDLCDDNASDSDQKRKLNNVQKKMWDEALLRRRREAKNKLRNQ